MQYHCCCNSRKFTLINRVIPISNSLSDHTVSSNTVKTFKLRLDKYWSDQDVIYNYKADLGGIRNCSVNLRYCVIIELL